MKDEVTVTADTVPRGNQGILRAFALAYPGAHEEFPWGERVIKVKGKVFVFLGRDEEGLEKPPMDVMRAWIDESYRAVAPKKLVATLPAAEGATAARAQKTVTPGKRKAR